MKIYNYRSDTKELIGESIAKKNPRDLNDILIPVNATTEPPPLTDDGQIAIWDNGRWSISNDYRGEKWYSIITGKEI